MNSWLQMSGPLLDPLNRVSFVPSKVPWRDFRSLACPSPWSQGFNHRSSGFCSSAASGNPCSCLRSPADVSDHLILVAIIAQRVRWQECWGAEDFRWRTQPLGSAGRQGVGSQQTFESRIWTSSPSVKSTTADWRWSLMASLCSGVRSLPSTPPWCLQSGATGRLDVSAQQSAEQLWTKQGGGRSGLTPSWRSSTVAPGWWFWAARWGDDGLKSHGSSWLHLRQPRRDLSQNSRGSPPCSAGFVGGAPLWLAPLPGLSPSPCWSAGAAWPQMVPRLQQPRWWRTTSGTWSEFKDRRLRCVLHDFCSHGMQCMA